MNRTPRSTGAEQGAPRPCFLVVDDNPVMCREIGRILSPFGDFVQATSLTLTEAHRLLDTIPELHGAVVDVLLMPGNGFEIVDRIQLDRPGLAILVVTGDLVSDRINEACRRDLKFLAKPFQPEALRAWAARAVEAWRRSTPPSDLPADLRRLAAKVLATANGISNFQGTYADHLGALARAASGRRLAGRSATAACAEAVGVSRRLLQAAGSLGARIAPSDVEDLFARRDCNGRHITPSHIEAISRLPLSTRADVVERIFKEGLGVEDVRSLARNLASDGKALTRRNVSLPSQNAEVGPLGLAQSPVHGATWPEGG